MTATNTNLARSSTLRKDRPSETRPRRSVQYQKQPKQPASNPAAGAHAATHLINEDATPGAGALPSFANASGKEVDGGAG